MQVHSLKGSLKERRDDEEEEEEVAVPFSCIFHRERYASTPKTDSSLKRTECGFRKEELGFALATCVSVRPPAAGLGIFTGCNESSKKATENYLKTLNSQ